MFPKNKTITVEVIINGEVMKVMAEADPHSYYTILNRCPQKDLLGEEVRISADDGHNKKKGRVVKGPIYINGHKTANQIMYVGSFPKTVIGWKQLHDLDMMKDYSHKGFMMDVPPVVIKSNRDPEDFREEYLKKHLLQDAARVIASWLREGIIERCVSPCNAPIRLATKPNGKVKIIFKCTDLNSCSEKEPPHPREHRLQALETVTPGKYYSVFKLFYAEFQIPLDTYTKYKTSFTFLGEQYVWNRLFGNFQNKSKRLSEALEKVLEKLPHNLSKRATFYADVILISAENKEDCERFTEELQRHLGENHFQIRHAQSQICKPRVTFLGREISQDAMRLGKAFVKKVKNMESPRDANDLRSILGCLQDANQHTPGFGIFRSKLTELTKENNGFFWNDECEEIWMCLKEQILRNKDVVLGLASDEDCSVQIFVKNGQWMAGILNAARKPYRFASGILPALKNKESIATQELKAMKEVWEKYERVLENRDVVWEVESEEIETHKHNPVMITNKKQLNMDFVKSQRCKIKIVPHSGRIPPGPWL